MNEEMLRGLTSRRSNRAFAPEQITDEELHKVLAAGMNAPTAKNGQSPIIIAVQNPDEHIRRGDFLLMLYGAAGKPAVTSPASFTDVSPSDYYYTAVSWAQANGLATGVGDGTLAPASDALLP